MKTHCRFPRALKRNGFFSVLLIASIVRTVAQTPAAEPVGDDVTQLRAKLAEQTARIDRLYEALAPQLAELEQRAAELKQQQQEDAALKLEAVCTLEHQDLTSLAQFSPVENSFAAITSQGGVKIFSAEGKLLRALKPPEIKANAIAYAPEGRRLLVGAKDGKVWLWDFASDSFRLVFTNGNGMIGRVAWLVNPERCVATADLMDRSVKAAHQTGYVFRPEDGRVLASFIANVRGDYQQLATSADGRWLGVLEIPDQPRGGFLLDATTGKMKSKFYDADYGSGPLSICIAPDNNTVAIGYAPYHVSLWDGAQQKELRVLKAHSNWVTALGFSPDGKRLISGGGDNTARLWEVATGKEIGRIRFGGETCIYVDSVGFSPDGKYVLAAASELSTGGNHVLLIAKAPR